MKTISLLAIGLPMFAQDAISPQIAALKDFQQKISDYISLERNCAKGISVNKPSNEPHVIQERQHELARKIREARNKARQGEIFTPSVAKEFRRLLGLAMAGKNDGDIEKSLARAEPVRVNLQVNDNYPSNVPLQSMPPTILLNLPRLPPELEYLINGHALVLHDTAANLIVDIIPDAVP